MPKGRFKKGFNKRRFPKKKMPDLVSAEHRIDAIQNKQIINLKKEITGLKKEIEVKIADEYSAITPLTTSGLLTTPLSPAPGQGATGIQRVGDEIFVTSWQIKGHYFANQSTNGPTRMRMIIFIDKEYAQADPILLRSVNNNSLLDNTIITDPTLSPFNQDTRNRFKILKDWTVSIQPIMLNTWTNNAVGTNNSVVAVVGRAKEFHFYIPIRKRIRFVQSTGTKADLIGPQPLMAVFTDQTANFPNINFSGRINFQDL